MCGMFLSFAAQWCASHPEGEIGLIPCAEGDTGLAANPDQIHFSVQFQRFFGLRYYSVQQENQRAPALDR